MQRFALSLGLLPGLLLLAGGAAADRSFRPVGDRANEVLAERPDAGARAVARVPVSKDDEPLPSGPFFAPNAGKDGESDVRIPAGPGFYFRVVLLPDDGGGAHWVGPFPTFELARQAADQLRASRKVKSVSAPAYYPARPRD